MNLLLHIEINDVNLLHYKKPIIDWSKAHIPEISTIDFDNHSDSFLIESALKLSKEAKKIVLILDVGSSEGNPGGVIKFLNALLRLKKDHVMIIYNGKHEILQKMVLAFKQYNLDLDFEVQKEKVAHFFNT